MAAIAERSSRPVDSSRFQFRLDVRPLIHRIRKRVDKNPELLVQAELFPQTDPEKDRIHLSKVAIVRIPKSACCPDGAINGHGRIMRDRLFTVKNSTSDAKS